MCSSVSPAEQPEPTDERTFAVYNVPEVIARPHLTSEQLEPIVELIRQAIASEQPRGAGTDELVTLDTSLHVLATKDNHERIAKVLQSLRKQHGVQVAIDSRVLVFDEETFRQLELKPGPTLIDDLKTDLLIRATHASDECQAINIPRITIFAGDKALMSIGGEKGLAWAIRATVGATRERMVLHIKPNRAATDQEVAPTDESKTIAKLQSKQNLAIVGGEVEDFVFTAEQREPILASGRLVVLFKPTIIIQDELEERLFPELDEKVDLYNLDEQRDETAPAP
jgi:hypothetical protein